MDILASKAGSSVGPVELAEKWERILGDPAVEFNSMSFARALELDERDEPPGAALDLLRSHGFSGYFVPERLGGALRRAEELLMLFRVVARRDMNVLVSEVTPVFMMLAWIGGDADQKRSSATAILWEGAIPTLGFTEPEHGADLAANTFRAEPDGEGYVLSGVKWPINRGSTSTHVLVLGDTGTDATPPKRRQSLFLVNRSEVVSGTIEGLPRVRTLGLRGCDISGVAFDRVKVSSSARLGAEGEGLELGLRGLLITRTFCTGLSLATGDTMLRTVADFQARRILYGAPAAEIPFVRDSLANAYLSLLVAECESLVAMRGLHLHLEEFSLWANFAKVAVSRLVDSNAQVLLRVLGAPSFMRSADHAGTFQKMLRDNSIISVFDGSEPVCLDSIAAQLAAMAKAYRAPRPDDWASLYDLRADLPDFEPARVSVFGRGRDAVFASLPELVRRLGAVTPSGACPAELLEALRHQADLLRQEVDALFEQVRDSRRRAGETAGAESSGKVTPPALLRLADRACGLHTKIAALGVWLYNRDHLDAFFADGGWLRAALARREIHRYEIGDLDPATARHLVTRMNDQRTGNRFFSIRTVQQAAPFARESTAANTTAAV